MRYLIVLAVAGVLACAGCSSSSNGGKTSAPASSSAVARSAYVEQVRPLYPDTNTETDLLNVGDADCKALKAGTTAADLTDQLGGTSLGAERTRAKKTITAAIDFLCPQFKADLPIKD